MSKSYFSQGNQLVRENKLEEAIIAYQNSTKQNPRFYLSYHNMGEALEKLGRLEEALPAYQKAVELKPKEAAPLPSSSLARVLSQLGRNKEFKKYDADAEKIALIKNYSLAERLEQMISQADRDSASIFLTNLEKFPVKEGISLVTCCMNRNDNLVHSLKTWLPIVEINEIIIVDWNSNTPVKHSLQEANIKDKRILIIRVIDQPRWILTIAYNVGLRLAGYNKILKIDADNQIISNDFFLKNQLLDENEFFAGNWKTYQARHLNGTFYAWKSQLSQVGYFNEYIQCYGWDDSDLYKRLEECEFSRNTLLEETMSCIQHGDQLRLAHQQHQPIAETSMTIKKIKSDPDYLIKFNKFLVNLMPKWTSKSKKVDFRLVDSVLLSNSEQYYELIFEESTDHPVIPQYLVDIASEIALRHKLRELYQKDDFIFDVQALQDVSHEYVSEVCLIVTLYNEENRRRCQEYIECLKNNLNSGQFSQIVVLFEQESKKVESSPIPFLLSKVMEIQPKYSDVLRIEKIDFRPTYNDIFEFANNALERKTIVVVANADIFFDETLSKVKQIYFEGTFLVLSRRELNKGSSLIREYKNGLPNYFSADSWIFQAPLEQDFRADYKIGTFFCDSFLNNQLSKSLNYVTYNPCFSINSHHLHDEFFNSSETKEKDTVLIQKLWRQEYEACNQSNPVAGYRWCTIEDVIGSKKVYALPQTYLARNIIVNIKGINPVTSILLINKILELTAPLEAKIWIYSVCDFNLDNLHEVHSLIRNYVECMQNNRLTCLEFYGQCDLNNYYRLTLKNKIDWEDLLTNIQTNTESGDQTTVVELVIDDCCEIELDMTSFISRSWNQSWVDQLTYGNPDLYRSYEIYKNIRETELSYNTSNNSSHFLSLVKDHYGPTNNDPLISIITSVYKGRDFIEGFLKNISKQTIFDYSELILIEGNSPENEGDIIKKFIQENGYTNIHYLRLDEDPGLYECWNIAIRQSRGKYVTNANLDDRRSPLHLEILVNHLEHNLGISAVSSALVVTYQPNEDWNFFTPEQVWFEGLSGEIHFDDLYTYKDNMVISRNTLHCMPLWKKELHDQYGYFDERSYGTSADWEFWLRCSSKGEKYSLVGLPLGLYYLNPNSHNRRNDADSSFELRIINEYFDVHQKKAIKQ